LEDSSALDRATARRLIERLNLDAERIARRFGLRYRSITAERAGVRSRYGVCYADGAIKIRLRHATTGRPLKYSSLVNTLCHELAHLRHFNHGPRFRAFYFEILDHARALGIYRPGRLRIAAPSLPAPAPQRRATAPGAIQLDLFG
jgi:predicted metal-dependent hydrolase